MSAYKKSLNSFLTLTSSLVLTSGVIMGVLLVKEDQDYRELANESKEHKVSVCHKSGSDNNSWVQLEVAEKSLNSHLEHGDITGNCPVSEKSGDESESGNTSNKSPGSDSGVALANNVTVNNQTVQVAETKYVYLTTQFEFLISFQGIDEKKSDKNVRVIFRQDDSELHVYNKVQVTSDAKGNYRGVITDVRPGTYDVLIKSDGFLQAKFEKVDLRRGKNRYDWSSTNLLAGDFNSDNLLNARDLAEFMSYITEDTNLITEETSEFDINMNGNLDFDEFEIVLLNFRELEIGGEE